MKILISFFFFTFLVSCGDQNQSNETFSSDQGLSQEHKKEFKKDLIEVTEDIYVGVGYGLANSIMFSQGFETANSLGNLIILGVPICFALQLTLINRRSDVDFMPSTFLSGILVIIVGLLIIQDHSISTKDLLLVLFMGAFQVGLGFMFITIGSRYIPPHRAALYILLEPILAPIWAWAGVGEKPPMIELLGGLIVFAFVTWRLIDEFIEKEKNN